jgi:hypothetical protein
MILNNNGTCADRLVPFLFSMTKITDKSDPDWPALLRRITLEVAGLDASERAWLSERVALIAALQIELDELFRKAGGLDACATCDGTCCGCGRHHVTLTNLLAYLLADETPPQPDFNRTCPFLGERGCLLTVDRRPYNCITFFCEILEDRLHVEDCETLRSLDQRLRNEYQKVAARYPAASLRGLWIALQRAGDDALLQPTEKDMIE